MSDLETVPITAVFGDDRWAANRIAGLARGALRLYALILFRFTEAGPPDRDELTDLGFSTDAVLELVDRDLIQLDADAQIAVAYPFSASPTRHQVITEDGRPYWAMCAIDALGMPYLLHQPAEIRAQEPDSERFISVAIDPDTQTVRSEPADVAVVVARGGDGCAAGCACPHINLFGSTAAAERDLVASELHGTILDLDDAIAAGRRAFGDLLDLVGAGGRR